MSSRRGATSRTTTSGTSRASSTTSSASSTYHRIPVVSSSDDRRDTRYCGDPLDYPGSSSVRRGSYYETGSKNDNYKYLTASDVRRQVSEAPRHDYSVAGNYPKPFHNLPSGAGSDRTTLRLSSNPPHKEFPIKPSNGVTGRNYTGGNPGEVRAFYNVEDRSRFDVGYKDDSAAPTAPRGEGRHARRPFTLATYHGGEGPTYTDTSTGRRHG